MLTNRAGRISVGGEMTSAGAESGEARILAEAIPEIDVRVAEAETRARAALDELIGSRAALGLVREEEMEVSEWAPDPAQTFAGLEEVMAFIQAKAEHNRLLAGVRRRCEEAEARTVLALLPWSALGLVVGTEILLVAEPAQIGLAAGDLVVLFAVALLRGTRLPGARGRWGPVVAGASTGVMATSTGLGGPPIVMLFAARGFGRDALRASMAAYLLALGTTTLCLLLARGVVEGRHLWISALLLPAAFAGKAIGTSVARRLPDKEFRKTILGLILLTGLVGVATGGWELLRGPG